MESRSSVKRLPVASFSPRTSTLVSRAARLRAGDDFQAIAQGGLRDRRVVKRHGGISKLLVGLMPFPGEQDDVPRLRHGDRLEDRLLAVRNHLRGQPAKAGFDIVDD